MEKKKIIKNVLKLLFIIIVVLMVFFVIHTIRNYIIITNLQSKISQYKDSTNYYTKSVTTENTGVIVKMEYYKKDDKEVVFLERNVNGEIVKTMMFYDGDKTDTFIETKDSKLAQLNSGTIMSINIYNHLETDNKWQTFLECISSKIKSTNYNGKECYIIKDFVSLTSSTSEGAETYVDKNTGLMVKTIEAGVVSEKEYEFNNVKDSIFVEPDISQYEIKEK